MKKLMFFAATLMIGFALQAQDRARDQDKTQLFDHLFYDGGALYQVSAGQDRDRIQLRDRIALNDGTVVNPDGSYQTAGGKQLRLRDGQCVDMEGNVYNNQNQFRRQVQSRLQANRSEHLAYQNGQVYRYRNNEQERVEEQVRLQNGVVVNPDGTYQNKNGKQLRLRDGECIDMEGNRYQSQNRFREKTAARLRERPQGRPGQGIRTQQRSQRENVGQGRQIRKGS